jgi:hypothetical protein
MGAQPALVGSELWMDNQRLREQVRFLKEELQTAQRQISCLKNYIEQLEESYRKATLGFCRHCSEGVSLDQLKLALGLTETTPDSAEPPDVAKSAQDGSEPKDGTDVAADDATKSAQDGSEPKDGTEAEP